MILSAAHRKVWEQDCIRKKVKKGKDYMPFKGNGYEIAMNNAEESLDQKPW